MQNHRVSSRRRLLKSGSIFLGKRKVPCTVRNLSDTGACLEVQTTVGIPSIFPFLGPTGVMQSCKVVWRNDTKMGVKFGDEQPAWPTADGSRQSRASLEEDITSN
jgi:hypothetical protein